MKLKYKTQFYKYKTWEKGWFKQIALLPCLSISYNPAGHFIETGVYTEVWVINLNFLIWDVGVEIYKDLLIN